MIFIFSYNSLLLQNRSSRSNKQSEKMDMQTKIKVAKAMSKVPIVVRSCSPEKIPVSHRKENIKSVETTKKCCRCRDN